MRIVLPRPMAARAVAVAGGEEPAAPLVPASTVVLLRDGADGVEVYLQRRHQKMAFAAGMYAFPGGRVEDADAALPDRLWAGPDPAVVADRVGSDAAQARAHVVAVVRELFEETGVLLARPAHGRASTQPGEPERCALTQGRSLTDLLDAHGLLLDAGALRAWSRWVTPRFERRRFDTWFFVAALPSGARPRVATAEAHDGTWVRPESGLRSLVAGEMAMLPPTWWTLRDVAGAASVQQALAHPPPMARYTVGWTTDGPDTVMVLPDHPAYPGDDPREGR